jgi:ABC-type antimicrobial peptide transport system permease subunit
MILRESVALVILGLALGLPLAMATTRWIKSFLFGVPAMVPAGIGAAVMLMAAVSTVAGYLPAQRATKVDPTTALRHE